jgi:hypothetical protein
MSAGYDPIIIKVRGELTETTLTKIQKATQVVVPLLALKLNWGIWT